MAYKRINRLLDSGLDKSQVVARITGTKDNSGGASRLTPGQLRAIGFGDRFISRVTGSSTGGGGRGTSGGTSGGGTGGGGSGGHVIAPPRPPRPGNPPPSPDPIDFNQSAYDVMRQMLNQYGLGSLSGVLRGLIENGITDQASITLQLQNTNEWKQRFAGNEALKAKGLGVLSPGEYLAVERSYAQVLRNYGLPEGFYDDPSDFAGWIGGNVSAAELQSRAQAWSDLANREDSALKDQLRAMGMGEGDLLAYMMDPERATPLIQRKYKSALIGAAARRVGLDADTGYAGRLADLGIDEQQAIAGYGVISESLGTFETLADVYDSEYTQRDFESEVFEGDGRSARKRRGLASQERAAFSGQSGVGRISDSRLNSGRF